MNKCIINKLYAYCYILNTYTVPTVKYDVFETYYIRHNIITKCYNLTIDKGNQCGNRCSF